jgi:hypothetical protein
MVWLIMLTVYIALEAAAGGAGLQSLGRTELAEQQYVTEAPCRNSAIKFIGEPPACWLGCRLEHPGK